MTKSLASALLIAAVATASAFGAPPLEIRGLQPGDPAKTFEAVFPGYYCHMSRGDDADELCLAVGQTFGAIAASYFATAIADRLASIGVQFDSSDFDVVLSAVTSKFGPPTRQYTEMVTTGIGVRLQNRIALWRQPGVSLRLTRYAASAQFSHLTLEPDDIAARRADVAARKRPGRLKDM